MASGNAPVRCDVLEIASNKDKMDGMGEAPQETVRLFHYVPQANCLPGKNNYIMKIGTNTKFRTLPE